MKRIVKYWSKSIGELVFLFFFLALPVPFLSLILLVLTYLDLAENITKD